MRERKKSEQKKSMPAPRGPVWRRRLVFGTLWLGIAAGAYCYGRFAQLPQAAAEPPPARAAVRDTSAPYSPEYSGRVIAYIHGTIPITREDLGEYLIARGGKERARTLINKKVIEYAAKQRGIEVTEGEINASLNADAAALNVQPKEFVNAILKRYNKSPFEWKEDVIKPRLILEKLARPRVSVTREDLAKAYEAYYGEKVDCLMIMWPNDELNTVKKQIWPLIRSSDKEFDHYARIQSSPSLASAGGHVKPIGRNTAGNENIERVLFDMRPGEVSQIIESPEGIVVFKCIGRVKPDTSVSFEQVQAKLEKEVFDKKVAIEVGKVFKELYAAANPKNFLEPMGVVEDVKQELTQTGAIDKGSSPMKALPAPAPGLPGNPVPSVFPPQ